MLTYSYSFYKAEIPYIYMFIFEALIELIHCKQFQKTSKASIVLLPDCFVHLKCVIKTMCQL